MGKITRLALSLPVALVLIVPPQMAEARNRNLAAGIGIGLIGGAIASRGDPGAMLGGAIAGGVVGGIVDHHRRKEYREWRRDVRDYRDRRDRRR